MKKIIIVLSFCFTSLFADKINVTVSILPQKYFVEQIAGDKVNINTMVKSGFSPATYEPQTSQMKTLSDSQVYFSIGVPFENVWIEKFKNTNTSLLVVDTSEGITKLKMEEHQHHDEGHEDEHHEDAHEKEEHHDEEHEDEHHENGLDPHTWLDPILVKIQAKNIYETLIKIDGENKLYYSKNYHNFVKQLDTLDQKLESKLKNLSEKAFMVFHPSWGYFAKRYNLEQIVVEKEGKEPKPKEIIELIKEAKKHQIKIVLVSPQFSQKAAKTVAQNINAKVISIDHLRYDYPEGLINTAQVIYNSYQ